MRQKRTEGITLVEVLIALAIMAVIALAAAKFLGTSTKANKSTSARSSLALTRSILASEIDCEATLGLTSLATTPLNCSSYSSITLRRDNGTEIAPGGNLNGWQISARCEDNEIRIGASKPGKDPATGRFWNSVPYARDIFRGLTSHCRRYFTTRMHSFVGGFYQHYLRRDGSIGSCRIRNTYTNQCSCPAGFEPQYVIEFAAGGTYMAEADWCVFYQDGQAGENYCGFILYNCAAMDAYETH